MNHIILIFVCLFLYSTPVFPASENTEAERLLEKAASYKNDNNPVKAFGCYAKGMMLSYDSKDKYMLMRFLGNLSIIYHDFGDVENSLYFAHKGYDIAQDLGNEAVVTFLSNFVSFYSNASDTANASKYYKMLREMLPKADNTVNRYFFIYERARMAKMNKDYDKAEAAHIEARTYAEKNNMPEIYVLFQNSELGNLKVKKGEYERAIGIGRECLSVAAKINSRDMVINSYRMLADAFNGLGQRDSSDHYLLKYYDLHGKVYDMEGFFRVHNEIIRYKDRMAEGRISRLNDTILGTAGFTLLLIILMAAFVRKNILLRRAQMLLIEKNRELMNAEAKDIALREKYVAMESKPSINEDMQEKLLGRILSVLEDISVISDPDFSLSMMAEKTESNTKYVSTVINRTYGKNFKTLLSEYRIKEACRRISDENYDRYTIKAIACDVGFRNTVSFIRCFKNVIGMTPSVYQKLSRKKAD